MTGSDVGHPPRLDDTQQRDWIRLYRSEHVGPATFRQLINRFGTAQAAIDALPELSRRGGLGRAIVILPLADAERELAAAKRLDLHFAAAPDPAYPRLLRYTDGAPPFLYVAGNRRVCERRLVAIVGARNASAIGRKIAAEMGQALGHAGFAIASGLARGIDKAAHAASLATGTIAVLAGGHDRLYPPEHTELAGAMTRTGALISEMPPDYQPRGRDFPRRNRIVSGIAEAVIVIEAARRSGSLITARLAGEQGRDVLAVPGSPLDPRADGTNNLIRHGATLVRHAADVLEALGDNPQPLRLTEAETGSLSTPTPSIVLDDNLRGEVAGLLSTTPINVDELARQINAPLAALSMALLELELAGRVERYPGNQVALHPA